jgi:modulator of FtsH protease HflK
MPWQHNKTGGGGPWGGGGGGSGGGGGGGGGGPWGRGPSAGGGGGQRPPDFEEILRRGQDRFRRVLPGGFGSGRSLTLIAIVAVILWMLSGIYVVEPYEQGVEMRFGKWTDTTGPGLHFNWPTPIGSVETPRVTVTNRVEVGFRTAADGARGRDIAPESLMLTGDENIIDIQFVVFWKIRDAGKFLFNIYDPEGSVHSVAEAAMREIVGQAPFEYVRTQGRSDVQDQAKILIQRVLDAYGAGIEVINVELQKVDPPAEVIEAFRDVQAARADKEKSINEAQAYYNEVTQRAEGQAQEIIKQAEGYKEEKIAIAKGDAQRFISVYDEYAKAKDLTKRRIYLETMEQVLKDIDKILIDNDGGGDAVPYLSLNELIREPRAAGRAAPQPAPAP